MNISRTKSLVGMLTALSLIATAAVVRAQDQPGVFVHGLTQSGSSWDVVASQLAQEFRITPYKPTYPWRDRYSTQRVQLNQQLPAVLSGAFAIGHSNGGPLSREWNRSYNRNDRIATIGAPNAGAPLAASTYSGQIFFWGAGLASSINNAVGFYYQYDWSRYLPVFVNDALEAMFIWGVYLPDILAVMGYAAYPATSVAAPVLFDLSPTSTYFAGSSGLNSTANLNREAQAMHARVGIVGHNPSDYDLLPYTFFGRDSAAARRLIRWRQRAWSFSLAAYLYYANYWNPNDPESGWLRSHAWRWGVLAMQIQDMDAVWCTLIGTLRPGGVGEYVRIGLVDYYINCEDSDGIVPRASQQYPGGTRERPIAPAVHTLLQNDPRTLTRLRETLEIDFSVPFRTPGSVSRVIVTPSSVQLAPGQSTQLSAQTFDYYGTPLGVPIGAWTSTTPSVASVSPNGTVTAHGAGTTLVIASSSGYADTTIVAVSVPALTVGFNGPASVRPGMTCSWQAVVGGGNTPYTYSWFINGSPVGFDDSIYEGPYPSSSFTLGLEVRDAASTLGTATLNVSVSSSAPHCLL
jgi:hypothetical protein